MNLDKLDVTVCMAFQASEGPFDVLIHVDGAVDEATLTKEEIDVLSQQEFLVSLEMSRRVLTDRRWIDRGTGERRS
jgi:hypothetical protein